MFGQLVFLIRYSILLAFSDLFEQSSIIGHDRHRYKIIIITQIKVRQTQNILLDLNHYEPVSAAATQGPIRHRVVNCLLFFLLVSTRLQFAFIDFIYRLCIQGWPLIILASCPSKRLSIWTWQRNGNNRQQQNHTNFHYKELTIYKYTHLKSLIYSEEIKEFLTNGRPNRPRFSLIISSHLMLGLVVLLNKQHTFICGMFLLWLSCSRSCCFCII